MIVETHLRLRALVPLRCQIPRLLLIPPCQYTGFSMQMGAVISSLYLKKKEHLLDLSGFNIEGVAFQAFGNDSSSTVPLD